ncbi:MAG: hypothetical protein R3183_11640 [Oleiphilaceae bacterium]|nr:hypothetical protein [Oleiphilaceae bacterium]
MTNKQPHLLYSPVTLVLLFFILLIVALGASRVALSSGNDAP